MPNSGYVKKSSVRWLVTGLVALLLIFMGVGLYVVRDEAERYATNRATVATQKADNLKRASDRKLSAALTYANNHTACGVRGFVTPALSALKKSEIRATAGSKDMTLSVSSRNRNKAAAIADTKQIASTQKVLDLFGTIPAGFNCKDLPKHAPKI